MIQIKIIASALGRIFKVSGIFAVGCAVGRFGTIWEFSTAKPKHVHNRVILIKEGSHLKCEVQSVDPALKLYFRIIYFLSMWSHGKEIHLILEQKLETMNFEKKYIKEGRNICCLPSFIGEENFEVSESSLNETSFPENNNGIFSKN